MEQLIFKGMETEEGRQAAALHNSIMAAKLAVSNALLDFCRGLKAMRDGKGYKALGFESFEEYSVHAVGIKYRMAANYISAYEALGEKMIAENADIGITKLALLAQISDPEERAEAAKENLNGMTVAEVKALVAEVKALDGRGRRGGKVQREHRLTQAEIEDIWVMYRDAKYKRQQIGILSEMYLVSKDTIAQVLGLEALPGGRGYKTRPAVKRQWL